MAFHPVGDPTEGGGGGAGGGDAPFFPASVVNYPHFSDHSPILVPVPCDAEVVVNKGVKRIRAEHLTEEDWELRDRDVGARLETRLPADVLEQQVVNISRFFSAHGEGDTGGVAR